MNVEFDRSFHKSIAKLGNPSIARAIEGIIDNVEKASAFESINNFKRLKGYRDYYRIRIGDYRIGLKRIDAHTLRFITVAHRREIYRVFP